MIRLSNEGCGYLTVEASGRLTASGYDQLVVRLEHEMHRRGRLQLLVLLEDFEGWTPAAMLDDLRFGMRHRKELERVAVVGARQLERIAARLAAPFFSGAMCFFESADAARAWLVRDWDDAAPPPAAWSGYLESLHDERDAQLAVADAVRSIDQIGPQRDALHVGV